MSQAIGLKVLLISLLAGIFLQRALAYDECTAYSFKCLNRKCISRRDFCDGRDDCKDNTDERYCGREIRLPCPDGWVRCPSKDRCIPSYFVCDGYRDCYGGESEEKNCTQEPCSITGFKCPNGTCINRVWVCNGRTDCGNNTDEQYCGLDPFLQCPTGYIRCPSSNRCILSHWKCDGIVDCRGRSNEERFCGNYTAKRYFNIAVKESSTTAETSSTTTGSPSTAVETSSIAVETPSIAAGTSRTDEETSRTDEETSSNTAEETPDITHAKMDLRSWLLRRRKSSSGADQWGSQIPRIAVALHLSDESTFGSDSSIAKEIRYELALQLLYRLTKDKKISSQELALYIHALLVACMDPRDFYGEDLVQELRRRVEAGGNYTNPFLLLVLCNAGDAMTLQDLLKAAAAYTSQHRHFWTDYKALAAMAIACISSTSSGGKVDELAMNDMLQELKMQQLRNGMVDSFSTTALVTQALFINDSYKKDFDLDSAMKVLINGLKGSKSVLDVYYALPVLNMKSLLYVTSGHCRKELIAEEEALQKTLDVNGETMTVHYSVWMGDEINVGRTWRLKVRVNSTIYDAIETVAKIDNRQKVQYNVVDDKPYVRSLNGKEDDPEMEMFWFVYLKNLSSDKHPKLVEESPVDVKLQPNQEIILWYKRGSWNVIQKPATSP